MRSVARADRVDASDGHPGGTNTTFALPSAATASDRSMSRAQGRRKEMRKIDLDIATFICVSAIEAVAHKTVLNESEMLSEKAVRVLVDETTRLVVGYLAKPI
jgi:7,8-dihydro-6-hydroxymethylpterin-pyrophosphokinase